MSLLRVYVVSTGWAHATKQLCMASVASQLDVEAVHIYIEASEQNPPKTKIQNLVEAIAPLPPESIVVFLDGDDFLSHKRALARVAQAHAEGMWLTYGSFCNSDGTPGFASEYGPNEDYRATHWRLTHLKSCRAGLFQRLRKEDLMYPCDAQGRCVLQGPAVGMRWIDRADDPAFFIPCAEQAGRGRVQWLRDVLYVYDLANAWHQTASQAELEHQAAIMALTRARPPYQRIDSLTQRKLRAAR